MTTVCTKRTFIPPEFRPRVKGEHLVPSAPKASEAPQAYEKKKKKKAIVCIHVAEDSSQSRVLRSQYDEGAIIFLTYDTLGRDWNFTFFQGKLTFHTEEGEIEPIGIYNRPYCPEQQDPQFDICNHFLRALDCWEGSKISPSSSHFHNSSKAYQLTTTLKHAIQAEGKGGFRFPQSFYIKGNRHLKTLLSSGKKLVVKSGSGIRSEVATDEQFGAWSEESLDHLPTFFQEACYGEDIRVHWMKEGCWQAILRDKKGSIDYRYAKWKSPFAKYEPDPKITKFCEKMAEKEDLHLVGVDFITDGSQYVCLECNPNPGWAGFHRACGDEPALCKTFINYLEAK